MMSPTDIRKAIRKCEDNLRDLNKKLIESQLSKGKETYPECFNYGDKKWTLTLNKYQRDNLVSLFNAIGYGYSENGQQIIGIEPFTIFNTGDWLGETCNMLEKLNNSSIIEEEDMPNMSRETLLNKLKSYENDLKMDNF